MGADAVRKLLDGLIKDRGTNYSEVSKAVGRNHAYIYQFIKAGTPRTLPEDVREKLAAMFGIEPDMFKAGKPRIPKKAITKKVGASVVAVEGVEYARLPQFDWRAAAGDGGGGTGEIVNHLLFRHDWLRSVTRAPLERLGVIEVQGDSMDPTLRSGDHVLVDTAHTNPVDQDGLYVLRISDGGLQVKRVQANPANKTFIIGSDNTHYKTLMDISPADVHIAGRVVWLGRRV